MSVFKNVADIQTADMLKLPVPEAYYHNIALKPSEYQKEIVASLAERAEKVRNRMVDSSVDNMLMITNDGRKLALDQRLVNPMLPSDPNSKAAKCAENVFEIWRRTADQCSTQMIFCDLSTPKDDGTFSVYDDVRAKVLELGVPVGLAVDGSASNDGSSLLEELRVAFLLHRLHASRQAPTGYDILKMATRGSARLLGRDDIGQLSVGKCADLFMIDSRRLELVGCDQDAGSVLGTVGVRGPVDYTVVQGRVTVRQGHLVTVDEELVAREANNKCRDYLANV